MREIHMRCVWFILELGFEDVISSEGALGKAMNKALDLQCEVFMDHPPHESSEGYKMEQLLIASTSRDDAGLCSQEIDKYLNIYSCEWIAPSPIVRRLSPLSLYYTPAETGSTGGEQLYANLASISRHNLKIMNALKGKEGSEDSKNEGICRGDP